jgi:hypothetical protein
MRFWLCCHLIAFAEVIPSNMELISSLRDKTHAGELFHWSGYEDGGSEDRGPAGAGVEDQGYGRGSGGGEAASGGEAHREGASGPFF